MPPLYDVHQSVCLSGWIWFGFISYSLHQQNIFWIYWKKKIICPGVTPLSLLMKGVENVYLTFLLLVKYWIYVNIKSLSALSICELYLVCVFFFFFWKLSKACFAHVPLLDIYLVVLTDRRTIQRYEISNFKFLFNLKKKPSHFKNFINDLSDMLWYMKMYGVVLIVNPFNPKST